MLVETARAEIGYREGAGNFTKYASEPMISRLYGWTPQNQPWCATYVNWAFLTAFGFDLGSRLTYGGTAACANSAQLFRNHGAFTSSPAVGDQAFFYSGGGINHTGIVVDVVGSTFLTVEGNYSDKVSEVRHNLSDSNVAGFGRPDWQIVTGAAAPSGAGKNDGKEQSAGKPEADYALKLPTIKYGATGNAVAAAQSLLNLRGFDSGHADGDFGVKTVTAVNRFQRWAFPNDPDEWDGICGRKTWQKLLKLED